MRRLLSKRMFGKKKNTKNIPSIRKKRCSHQPWGGCYNLVNINISNFTVSFLGNYWCLRCTFYDTCSPPARHCLSFAEYGKGRSFALRSNSTLEKLDLIIITGNFCCYFPVKLSGQQYQLYFICTTRLEMGRWADLLFS